MKTIIAVFFLSSLLLAQNGSWWEPQFPLSSDTITIYLDPAQSSEIPGTVTSMVLHWGVNETSPGKWQTPPMSLWPAGTVIHNDGIAVRSSMTKVENIWQIKVPTDTTITTLHYVVNSGTPSNPGPNWGHSDGANANWNITLSQFRIRAILLTPTVDNSFGDQRRSPVFLSQNDSLQVEGTVGLNNTLVDSLALFLNDILLTSTSADNLNLTIYNQSFQPGFNELNFVAVDSAGVADTVELAILVNPAIQELQRPAHIEDGINYIDQTTVTFSLYAPYKEFVYVIGDFNDWMVDTTYFMHKYTVNEDSVHWWLTLDNLTPGIEYGFQYLVDGQLRIADPYARKLLDGFHDAFIGPQLYPDLKAYPQGKTADYVSVLQINQQMFNWVYSDTFRRPDKHELVIYELLLRDFLHAHDYATLIDTLDYLENLGINAIELMPVNEFDANSSWGYNPAFYFAPDKYYGPEEDLKRFIDECHRRGIAVILDMVLNHSFGQSPFVRLYNEGGYGRPTPQNPWLNVTARHPFNVGYDFNHESAQTKALVDRVNAYWLIEFKVDGFRFDLSKGFTQKFTTDVGIWSQYDASRIALLKRMADQIWNVDPETYVILEHFAENREDKELADYGMLMWSNLNTAYAQSSMGWLEDETQWSDLSGAYYKTRNFIEPNLLAYMESHDEPWIMNKNLNFGRGNGNYNIQDLSVALNRIKLIAVFYFTIPGPKMIWQFGELGYDQLLPEGGGRTAEKPILWNYYEQENRIKLYKVFAALIKLRREHPVFHSAETNVIMKVGQGQYDRRIILSHPTMNATIFGNFHVVPIDLSPNLPAPGTWYDYFSGEERQIVDPNASITLQPGEFHIYTSQKLETPEDDILNSVKNLDDFIPLQFDLEQNYPNPFNPVTTISFVIPERSEVTLKIYNLLGQEIQTVLQAIRPAGRYQISWDGRDNRGRAVGSGVYIYRLSTSTGQTDSRKMILIR